MKLILLILTVVGASAGASTFVGNGGGQGDVELSVTRRQIRETLSVILKSGTELCRCNSAYSNRSVCDALSSLKEDEIKFCTSVLKQQAPELLKLAEDSSGVTYHWTTSQIEVKEAGKSRAVDAVTDPAKKQITINIDRFIGMKPFERVFLVSHELAHLTQYDGKPMSDEGAIGAFRGGDGGRRLLNAMGSATAIQQANYPREIRGYSAVLRRSQSWKSRWLELNFGRSTYTRQSKQTFGGDDYDQGQVVARYNFGDFGLLAAYKNEQSERTALETIKIKEQKDIASLGVAYRFFLFSEPLTFWGQSHIQVQATLDFVFAKVRLSEELVSPMNDRKNAVGGTVAMNYYFPIVKGFWPYLGVSYEYHPFKYSKVNIDNDRGLTSAYIGGAYAF